MTRFFLFLANQTTILQASAFFTIREKDYTENTTYAFITKHILLKANFSVYKSLKLPLVKFSCQMIVNPGDASRDFHTRKTFYKISLLLNKEKNNA